MLLFILSIFLLTLFIREIFNYLPSLNKLEFLLILFLIICAYLILLLEIAGLLNSLNKPIVIVAIQLFVCCLVYIVKRLFLLQNKPSAYYDFKSVFFTLKTNFKKYWGIYIYAGLILLVYLFLLYIEFKFPQNTSDSLYNHLSRIGYWLQQGSLKTYFGFSIFGTTYPYNNSLLMLWSMVFLSSDKLVGLVQYFATFILALTIYLTGNELGFSKKGNVLAALITLTFPIIVFESITAQSDILVVSFLMIAFYFLLRNLHKGNKYFLIFSILAYAMAIGTKQNAIFSLPGYFSLFVYTIIKNKTYWKSLLLLSVSCSIFFSFFFGGFAYIQNMIVFGSPIGIPNYFQEINKENQGSLFDNLLINSLRLSYQFLSCEGVSPQTERACTSIKASLLQPILVTEILNIESQTFLSEPEQIFTLDRMYALNEEQSWFGIHGWLIFLFSLLTGIIYSIKHKLSENIILLFSSLIFFIFTAMFISFRGGWDPNIGRFLIFSIALVAPFASLIFSANNKLIKIWTFLLCLFSLYSMVFCIANNDSRPLISEKMFFDMSIWGKNNSKIVQKISDRLIPQARHARDVWDLDQVVLRTFARKSYASAVTMLNKYSAYNASIGVLALPELVPDYNFFGESFDRKIIAITSLELLDSLQGTMDFLLVSPDFLNPDFEGYTLISSENKWRLFIPK